MDALEIKRALKEMKEELNNEKENAEKDLDLLKNLKPEDISLDEEENPEYNEEEVTPEDEENELEEHKKHPIVIKTPEDAKKVLEEAKEDIQQVVDNLEGVIGESEEEESKVAFKRINDKYASQLQNLGISAERALEDARNSLKHWSFLKNRIKNNKEAEITNPILQKTLQTVKEAKSIWKQLGSIFGSHTKESTAVPPTGAKFTGDKWPNKKNPAEVELRHWNAGQEAFTKDNKKYNDNPNSASEPRLQDSVDPHDEKPYVNASYNDVGKYWDIIDTKTNKAIRYSFANAPIKFSLNKTAKTEDDLKNFSKMQYGKRLADAVRDDGIESVKTQVNASYINIKEAEKNDKTSIRSYYTEAFGDADYAKKLTSTTENGKMNIDYKPEKDEVKNDDKNPEFGESKDGAGKISSQDKELLEIKAKRALEVTRLAAAAGVVDFNKQAFKKYAMELMDKSDETIATLEETFNNMELVNEAALDKTATIPDADSGIVGNKYEGVRNPKAKAETEGKISNNVAEDAKIANKTASFVPQMSVNTPQNLQISSLFTTTEKKLREKGILPESLRLRIAKYRTS